MVLKRINDNIPHERQKECKIIEFWTDFEEFKNRLKRTNSAL